MGLFSSSRSSKTEYNTSQNSGFSEVAGGVSSVNASNSDVALTVTDRGAVKDATQLATRAVWQSGVNLDRAFEFGGKALDVGSDNLESALDFVKSANQQSQEAVAGTTQQFTNKFSEFANRQSASSDQRVMDVAKWGIAALVGLAAWNSYNRRKGAA